MNGTVRYSITVLLAALVLVGLPADAYAVRTIGLSSGTFKFELDEGQKVRGKVIVSNDGDEEVSVLVYAADQEIDDSGNIDYKVPTRADITQRSMPSSWVGVTMPEDSKSLGNVPYMVLRPGQQVPVKFTVDVPNNVPPGDHNLLLFFEMFEQRQQADGAQTIVSGRIGARVTLRMNGDLVERIRVRPFEVPGFVIGSEVPYRFMVNNEGNVDQRVTANAVLRDGSGNDLASKTAIDSRLVFAEESLEATGKLVAERSPMGRVTVALDVVPVDDEGRPIAAGRDLIEDERQVWMVPLWLVFAIGAVAVLLAGRGAWWVARRPKRETGAQTVVSERAAARAARQAERERGSYQPVSEAPEVPEHDFADPVVEQDEAS